MQFQVRRDDGVDTRSTLPAPNGEELIKDTPVYVIQRDGCAGDKGTQDAWEWSWAEGGRANSLMAQLLMQKPDRFVCAEVVASTYDLQVEGAPIQESYAGAKCCFLCVHSGERKAPHSTELTIQMYSSVQLAVVAYGHVIGRSGSVAVDPHDISLRALVPYGGSSAVAGNTAVDSFVSRVFKAMEDRLRTSGIRLSGGGAVLNNTKEEINVADVREAESALMRILSVVERHRHADGVVVRFALYNTHIS